MPKKKGGKPKSFMELSQAEAMKRAQQSIPGCHSARDVRLRLGISLSDANIDVIDTSAGEVTAIRFQAPGLQFVAAAFI